MWWKVGSPPLARGKVYGLRSASGFYGITPACAGKSLTKGSKIALIGDHPRLRGEKQLKLALVDKKEGSPPLARGKETIREKQAF